jgi:hypothetical protein
MSSEKTNKTATYVLAGFGGLAAIALLLWAVGVFKAPTQEQLNKPGVEAPLGPEANDALQL